QNDELKFLSQEEQEILHFFEKTIDSLEQSLEEDELRPQMQAFNNSVVDGASKSGPNCRSNPKDQDIIDLVRPKPDLERSRPAAVSTNIKLPETSPRSPLLSYRKPDAPLPDSHRGFETKYSPPAYSQNYFPPPPPPATQAETSAEFNSYGGKSIVLNPTASFKSELPPSPVSPEPKSLSPILAAPTEFNSYGGKSKVMTPIPVPASRRDLPDILSSHIDKSQTQHSENAPTESNNYGGKTRMFNPSGSANRPSEGSSRTVKPPAPTPAPRPPRHSYHGPTSVPKPPQRALSPDNKRRTGSLFRPQGITVQFSGKGASEESRKEALKKLGL
ncbi:hypothetical protein NQD34_017002, partial [Periophthalmus magnuspinnatus]